MSVVCCWLLFDICSVLFSGCGWSLLLAVGLAADSDCRCVMFVAWCLLYVVCCVMRVVC